MLQEKRSKNMQEQIQRYELKNQKSFKLKDIFECGQCFRWNEEKDGSYTGIWKNNVMNITQKGQDIFFEGICLDGDIKDEVSKYFDLERNYEEIKEIEKLHKYTVVAVNDKVYVEKILS